MSSCRLGTTNAGSEVVAHATVGSTVKRLGPRSSARAALPGRAFEANDPFKRPAKLAYDRQYLRRHPPPLTNHRYATFWTTTPFAWGSSLMASGFLSPSHRQPFLIRPTTTTSLAT